jgi:hypothetical protein
MKTPCLFFLAVCLLPRHSPAEEKPKLDPARQAEIARLRTLPPTQTCKELRSRTPRELRTLLGPPRFVARQVFYQCSLEQWVYEAPIECRVEILSRLGREPQTLNVHLTQKPR